MQRAIPRKDPKNIGEIFGVCLFITVKSLRQPEQRYLISVTGGRDTGLKPRIADLVPGSWAQVSLNYILHQVKNSAVRTLHCSWEDIMHNITTLN
jgi:hypothetical protein